MIGDTGIVLSDGKGAVITLSGGIVTVNQERLSSSNGRCTECRASSSMSAL